MATFKAIVFANRTAFDGLELAIYNYFKAKFPNDDVTTNWSNGIDSLDSNEVLMALDERVLDYPSFNPHTVVDVEKGDVKWFSNLEI